MIYQEGRGDKGKAGDTGKAGGNCNGACLWFSIRTPTRPPFLMKHMKSLRQTQRLFGLHERSLDRPNMIVSEPIQTHVLLFQEWRESLPRELDFCHEHDALERAGKKLREAALERSSGRSLGRVSSSGEPLLPGNHCSGRCL